MGAKKKSDGRDWQTTQEEAVRLALCILLAPDGGDLLATEFLREWAARRCMSPGGTAERLAATEADGAADCGPGSAERQFQRIVRSLSPACLEAFEADRTAGAMRRRRQAQGWLRSVRLVRWTGQVKAKALAPTARSVLEQAA